MANAEFLKVHHYRRVPGSTQVQLMRKTPYKAFVSQGQPTVFIREGKAFAEDGRPFEGGIPGWVQDILVLMPAKDLQKLGLQKAELVDAATQPEEAPQEGNDEPSAEREPEASEGEGQLAENLQEAGQGVTGVLAERRARKART